MAKMHGIERSTRVRRSLIADDGAPNGSGQLIFLLLSQYSDGSSRHEQGRDQKFPHESSHLRFSLSAA